VLFVGIEKGETQIERLCVFAPESRLRCGSNDGTVCTSMPRFNGYTINSRA